MSLMPVPKLIEDGSPAFDERVAKQRQLYPLRTTVEKTDAKGLLECADRSRDRRLGGREQPCGFAHAAGLCHSHHDPQIVQADPSIETPQFVHGYLPYRM